jgi:hypothetical protein
LEVTTSNSKSFVGRGGFFFPNHTAFVFEGVQNKVKGRESLLDTKKALL